MDERELIIFVVGEAAARQGHMPLHQALRGTRATAPESLDELTAEDLSLWANQAAHTIL